jgi:putative membrane protein
MIVSSPATPLKMLRYVARPLLLLLIFDMIVAAAYVFGGWTFIAMPHIPLTIFGGVIGVIVGFRNSSSYQRWWEARKLWGAIVNNSRTLARQALTFIADSEHEDTFASTEITAVRRRIVLLQMAYVHALRCHLRGQPPWNDLAGLLPDEDLEWLRQHRNVPLILQQRIAETLKECFDRSWIDTIQWRVLDTTLTALANAQGGAERIKNTPMPRQYDFFPQLFVNVYCLLLPLGLVANLKLLTPIGSSLVGFIFLALDETGRDLENPFENNEHDVPLTSISRTVEINLKQLLGDSATPEPEKANDGVLW